MEAVEHTRQSLVEAARDKVLASLDEFAKESGLGLNLGATDGDLPELFKGIDAHVDRLIKRSGKTVKDEQ